MTETSHTSRAGQWWRDAVIYQIYPRSWADSDGDGIGDLPGITPRLRLPRATSASTPCGSPRSTSRRSTTRGTTSPTTATSTPASARSADADALIAAPTISACASSSTWSRTTPPASTRGSGRPWPRPPAAPNAPGTCSATAVAPRATEPPNNWVSVFGGPGWSRVTEADGSPGQWYLHIFDVTQPDFDWTNPEVRAEIESVIRFWLDRGADGFRIDVAHGLVKEAGLPDGADPAGPRAGGRTARPADVGPARRARDLPAVAPDHRLLRGRGPGRRPHPVRRGVGAADGGAGPLRSRPTSCTSRSTSTSS